MIRKIYGWFLLLIFFGLIIFLSIFKSEKIFDLAVNVNPKGKQSKKIIVEQSVKGVYLVDSQKNDTNWELWSEQALSSSTSSSWRFTNVKVHFYTRSKKVYKVNSQVGFVDLKEKKMTFEGQILIESPNGYFMQAKTLEYNFLDKKIFTDNPVKIDTDKKLVFEPLKLEADSMVVNLGDSKINLENITSNKIMKKRGQVSISSSKAILSGESYMIQYKQNVKLKGMGLFVSSNYMKLFVSRNRKSLSKIDAIGNVKVISGNRVGTSGLAKINVKNEIITMLKSPKLKQGSDVLLGEEIVFYNKTKSVSVKKARAKVDKNTLETYNESTSSK